jgi:hypothetical protein
MKGIQMHQNAINYDKGKGYDTQYLKGDSVLPKYPKGFIPENRPCDWCGDTVEQGFIHAKCASEEAKHWLNILY